MRTKKILSLFFAGSISLTTGFAQYCNPTYTIACTSDDYINSFSFNTLSNPNSGCNGNANNYILYPALTTTIQLGETYPLTIQSGNYSQYFAVWIDFNKNNSFADAGEAIVVSSQSLYTLQTLINIPVGGPTGVTRMRVRSFYSNPPSSSDYCTATSYGECEDYNITLLPAAPCTDPPIPGTPSATKTKLCDTNEVVLIKLNGFSSGSGQTYTWERSTDSSNWATVPTATTSAFYTNIIQTSWYRCKLTCGTSVTSSPVKISIVSTPTASVTFTNPTCAGLANGTATCTITGGTAPFSYLWTIQEGNDTFPNAAVVTGLTGMGYDLYVSDANGCKDTTTFYPSEPSYIYASIPTGNTACGASNGYADANVSGGTTPYTYSWSSGQTTSSISGLAAGLYTLTITDSAGCQKQEIVGIDNTGGPTLSSQQTDPTCYGLTNGSATITVTSGSAPYTYAWTTNPVQTDSVATGLKMGTYYVSVTDINNCITNYSVTIYQPDSLTTDAWAINHETCPGYSDGQAATSEYGGTGPYSYLWSNSQTTSSLSNLSPISLTVTVTDVNGCTATDTLKILSPNDIVLTTTSTNVDCNGASNGSATVTVSGGVPPYNYNWDPAGTGTTPTVTGLAPGVYSVTVTDAGTCSISRTASVSITQPPILTLSPLTITNVTCNGLNNGSLSAAVSGGVTPYTYNWSTAPAQTTSTASGLAPGSYSITITDANGCTTTSSANIIEPAVLTANIMGTNATCFGVCNGTAGVTPAGGNVPYTYNWSIFPLTTQNITGVCAGTHSVMVSDNKGCNITKTITINEPADLLSNVSTKNISCPGKCDGSVTSAPTGGTSPYTYNWSSGGTNNAIYTICAGGYTLTLSDNNGCQKTTTVSLTQPAPLTLSLSATSTSCFNTCTGTGVALAAGGTAPYTYGWYPSLKNTSNVTGLCIGTQTVVLLDKRGCSISDTISVNGPLPIPVTASATPTSCGATNGTAAATVSGPGTIPPITYLWNTGKTTASINGLKAAIYRVNVMDGNGCFSFADALVSNSNGPILTVDSIEDVSCFGLSDGGVYISVSGGAAPYNYKWSNGASVQDISGLGYGPYDVVVTDAGGCTATESYMVMEPGQLTLAMSAVNSGCAASNGSASVITTGGTAPYIYAWSNGDTTPAITGISAMHYQVIVTDSNNCVDSAMIAVSDSGGPVVFIDTISGVNCGGSGFVWISPLDSMSISDYLWNTGGTTQNLNNAQPGNYGVVVTDTSGCKSVLITPVSPVLPPLKPICVVSVDTANNTNMVVWEKPVSTFISGFNIYRESSINGIYQKVAFHPYGLESIYYDSIADPNDRWSKYRIATVDICGAVGPLSPEHKTIHLSLDTSSSTSTGLIWDPYMGDQFTYYYIFRKDSSSGIWNLIDSVTANKTNYQAPISSFKGDSIYFLVGISPAIGDCQASIKGDHPQAKTVKGSKSNSDNRGTPPDPNSGIAESGQVHGIEVFPNPASDVVMITSKYQIVEQIRLFNALGELVLNERPNSKSFKLQLGQIAPGMYQLEIKTPVGTSQNKLLISK